MRIFVLLFGMTVLTASEWSTIRTSPEEQVRIFHEIAAKSIFSCYDTDGNISFVCFNHSKFAPNSPIAINRRNGR